jgi:hypothetical protein
MEQEENKQENHTSKWQVDIKAPSPGNVRGECAANEWTNNRRDPINCTV